MATWAILGGVLCESTYAYLAIEGILLFDQYPDLDFWANWAIIILLFLVGFGTFFQTTSTIQEKNTIANGGFLLFLKGISLSLFNPALLPFWVIVLLEYKKHELLIVQSFTDKALFVSGAGLGTFSLVYTYSMIAEKKRRLIFKYLTDSRLNKLIGGIFLCLAFWKLTSTFM